MSISKFEPFTSHRASSMTRCSVCGMLYNSVNFHACPMPSAPVKPEAVNHPDHYNSGEIECIDAIRAALTAEEYRGFCKGNVLKYVWRERNKGKSAEDIEKATWYLGRVK